MRQDIFRIVGKRKSCTKDYEKKTRWKIVKVTYILTKENENTASDRSKVYTVRSRQYYFCGQQASLQTLSEATHPVCYKEIRRYHFIVNNFQLNAKTLMTSHRVIVQCYLYSISISYYFTFQTFSFFEWDLSPGRRQACSKRGWGVTEQVSAESYQVKPENQITEFRQRAHPKFV